jgi:hypothetical protein
MSAVDGFHHRRRADTEALAAIREAGVAVTTV